MPSQNIQNVSDTAIRLIRRGATANLRNLFHKLHPADIADVIRRMDSHLQDQSLSLISDPEKVAHIFSELGSSFLEDYISRNQNYPYLVSILQNLPFDDSADLVGKLPKEMSQELLGRLKVEQSEQISDLLQYKESTAGGLMTTEVFKLSEDITVQEAIKSLQLAKDEATVFYIYIVDSYNHLTGVLSIRHLFQVDASSQLKDVMFRDVVRVTAHEHQEEVARMVAQYDLVAIPVVDDQDKLVGVITVDDVIDVIHEEAAEDVLRMGMAEVEDLEEFNFFQNLFKKLPWFLFLLAGGILTCEVITYFYQFLPSVGIFAGFIPLILRLGGVIARQSSTIVVQGISQKTLSRKKMIKILLQQVSVTVLIVLFSTIIIGTYSTWRFHEIGILPFAIGISLISSMLLALLLGNFLPLCFNKVRLDPALATGSIINFMLDVLVLLIYFSVLIWML